MSVWFTSDLHIGHEAVARMRVPWREVGYHDRMLACGWDSVVKPDDQVWVLGDLTVGGTEAVARALNWISDRPGVKHLIAGNHDPVHPMYRDSHRWLSAFGQVFASVQPFARRKIGDHRVLLSHFPYVGDRGEDRCSQYRLRDEGMPILHGHTHSADGVSWAARLEWSAAQPRRGGGLDMPLSRITLQVHVGVDAWRYAPVHLDTVADLLRAVPELPGASV